ncbi:MAG: T9SS type A sorting domain-containing protein [bacterium]|nr:T9SS type A sorting domain-containing protein [bacterium]
MILRFTKLILCISIFLRLAHAQEIVTPLGSNFLLKNETFIASKNLNKGNSIAYPVVDFFTKEGKPNPLFWEKNSCEILGGKLVFNALDSLGTVYQTLGKIDELRLNTGTLPDIGRPAFLSFTLYNGSTSDVNDSFDVFVKNQQNEWQLIWHSTAGLNQNQEVVLTLPYNLISTTQFSAKFVAYSANLLASNTSVFEMANLVVSHKWPFPFYNHLREYSYPDSTPNWNYYAASNVKLVSGELNVYPYGNCAFLDVLDANQSVYRNANNSYGGADTFFTHPFDVSSFAESDSILYSFALKSFLNNQIGDSLIVEFKNNLGIWVRVLSLHGGLAKQFTNFNFLINSGRFRHANFQSRFVFKTNASAGNVAHWLLSGFKVVKRIPLPFFDDFSNSRIQVSSDRWIEKQVYVNNDFPFQNPSINVATFDGLDQYGNAYSKFPIKGTCDVLTSHSMNLKGLTVADSVIFSFYYQYEPQGTTNQIYPDDSLILEFRSSAFDKDSFAVIKMFAADDSLLFKFTFYEVAITNPKLLHDDFQIRIRNRGSLTGNLSQWHVDYIRFNKGRKFNDPIKDLALSNTPSILLGAYTSLPWYQYNANKGNYGSPIQNLRLVNHDNQAYAVDYFRSIIKPEGDTLDKFNNILPTILPRQDSAVVINKPFNFATAVQADSLVFQTKYKIKISGNQNDNVTGNDTFAVPTIFSNYYAYDDGTAEGGYGVQYKLNVGANLKYKLEVPDSVVGVYIFFNQSEKDVSTQRFNIKIWKTISPLFEPATSDVVLYNQEVIKPTYTNVINGFTSYRFVEPIPVTDSFYIGWDQTSSYVLNVGLDKNYYFGVNPNMHYKMDSRWYPSEIMGALMIRPIMSKFLGAATGLSEPNFDREVLAFDLFPNPAKEFVKVNLPHSEDYHIQLFDLMGKNLGLLPAINGEIKLPQVVDGIYLMSFVNKFNGQKIVKKIIINN